MIKPRVIISSIIQFSGMARDKPSLLNLPAFNWLKQIVNTAEPQQKGCNCKKSKHIAGHREQFEAAMSILSNGEQVQLKKILETEKICFNKKEPDGKIKLICF